MSKSYDRDAARRLVPLLASITAEIFERQAAIRDLEKQLNPKPGPAPKGTEALELKARLAEHRRELRRAREELTELGCVQDELEPTQVRIPGRDGALDNGFSWQVGAKTVSMSEPDASTA